jgi:hypothetical protein
VKGGGNMMKKIVGIFICMLLIATIVLPVLGVNIGTDQKYTQSAASYELEIEIDTNNLNDIVALSGVFEIYEGQNFILVLTARWNPPNATKTICLWVDNTTMPAGATFTPPCNCALGEVTSIFEWTPAVGQAGIYEIIFYIGTNCSSPLGSFIEKIIVLSSGQDDPPLVVIQSPENGTNFNSPNITLTGIATDDIGLLSIGFHHEWTGDETIISGTIPQTTYYSFSGNFNLHEGWNRITVFVSDTKNQHGEDQIVLYYEISTNQPPNKPSTYYNKADDQLVFTATDPDLDKIRYGVSWDNDGNIDQWSGLYNSGSSTSIDCNGRKGTVGVIAEDEHGAQSDWVSVKSKNKTTKYPIISCFFEKLVQRFPFFEKILKQTVL